MRPTRWTLLTELDPEPLDALLGERVLGRIRSSKARISVAIRDFSDARAATLRRVREGGTPLVAWVVLPEADGYWCHARNVEAVRRRVAELDDWAMRNGLDFEAIAFDVEPDIHDETMLPTAGLRMLPRLLRTVVSEKALKQAESEYAAIADEQRAKGREVLAYGVPFLADELRFGTTRLRRTLGTVAIPGAVHVPMLYSSFARPFGSALIRRYSRTKAIALGSTGGGVTAGGLDRVRPLSWAELERDLAIARCDDVHLFSLEGCVQQGFLDRLA